jgi:integrase
MKATRKDTFPLIIKKGHASVKIYRGQNRGKDLFTLAFQTPSGRRRQFFTSLDDAKREANTKVANLAQGDVEGAKLNGQDRVMFVAAQNALEGTGITVDIAAREFATAFKILGHDAIIEAARFYRKHIAAELPDITVADAVAKFAEAKAAAGMSRLYLKDIRVMLGRLATAFACNLKSITPDDLSGYMQRINVGPVARNNHKRLIVALFNFAKLQKWLREDETTAADALQTAKVKDKDVEIYTPCEVAALLHHANDDFLPWLLLIAFGGIRREELAKGLKWEAVNFENRTITVPADIAKTGKKRKISMQDNLAEWLAPYRAKRGAIYAKDARKNTAKVSAGAGVQLRKNALRHSFGSYRMEQTKNAGQVSLEMGNSPKVVMDCYFEITDAKDAAAYWNIRPADAGKVVTMAGAAA